ncbi:MULTISPECIES: site-specific integrase [unclassified Leucobacter]|uniref:site-specific integrase n=1 Tax=unclassified Leucobacter TaxID=2621730 RepID=UPI000622604D|nr:site-specific integrase [Leucobacter sp. Ag1]KKI16408.1 integrase [Leucobacter sp. Ag1]
MATITAYQTAAGKRYRVRYRKPDKTQTDKRGFKTKKEAELWAATITVSKAAGQFIDPRAGRLTIDFVAEKWIVGVELRKPSTAAALRSSWRTHVQPAWGSWQVSSVDFTSVQQWVAGLTSGIPGKKEGEWIRKPKSATTVQRAHGVLVALLDAAARDRMIPSNPARGVVLPKKGVKPHPYLTHSQVAHLVRESGRHGDLVNVLAYTGVRWGEATGFRVMDLNVGRRRLRVAQNAVTVGGKIKLGPPKTHRMRTVPVPAFLVTALADAADGRALEKPLLGDGADYLKAPSSKRSWFEGAVKRCQKVDSTFPTITPHDLRHTAASLAVSSGANVKVVQRMLGHATAAMTLDVYADLFDDDLDLVGDAMDAARRAHILPTVERGQQGATGGNKGQTAA